MFNQRNLLPGFINTLLSWKAFLPLSRLAFTVYLVHYSLQGLLWNLNTFSFNGGHLYCVRINIVVFVETSKYCIAFVKLQVFMILSSLVLSLAFAAILFICFEIPLSVAEKLLFEWIFDLAGLSSKKRRVHK